MFAKNVTMYRLHDKVMDTFRDINEEYIFNHCQDAIKRDIPSILSSIVPSILWKSYRQVVENRLNNVNFTIAYRRSHRLPLISNTLPLQCTCGKDIDIYGDYIFLL